jgi:hypothetical protein
MDHMPSIAGQGLSRILGAVEKSSAHIFLVASRLALRPFDVT